MSTSRATMDPRMKLPTTIRIVGPTMCGKTQLMKRMILNPQHTFQNPELAKHVLVLYNNWQPSYDELKKEMGDTIKFHKGIPRHEEWIKNQLPRGGILVLDDLMDAAGKSEQATNIFTRGAHHDHISPISIEQNLFPSQKNSRTQRLNTLHLFLFKSPSDQSAADMFSRKSFVGETRNQFLAALERATDRPYGYLMIDLNPHTQNHMRFRSNVTQGDPDFFTWYLPEINKEDEKHQTPVNWNIRPATT